MTLRVVEVEFCGDCTHRYYKDNDLYCGKTNKETGENLLIPNWCPLPVWEPIKFFIGNNAPAYSCNEPGDNSGTYVKIETTGGAK